MIGTLIGYDICKALRDMAGSNVVSGLVGPQVLREAADEIERLRKRVRDLEAEKDPRKQYEHGVADAKSDIRRALGIDD